MKDKVMCLTLGQCIVLAIIVTGTVGTDDSNCNGHKADMEIGHSVKLGKYASWPSLSENMWTHSQSTSQKCLQTDFIKNIRTGVLDPRIFGNYEIQDAVFLQQTSVALQMASASAQGSDIERFLTEKSSKYNTVANAKYKEWQLSASSCVKLDSACQDYNQLKINVANNYDHKYTVVAMIPHLRLRKWIVDQYSSSDFGVYKLWAEHVLEDYYEYEKKVDKWSDDGDIHKGTALRVYTECMDHELLFLKSLKK